jgi:hypothetical protein
MSSHCQQQQQGQVTAQAAGQQAAKLEVVAVVKDA